MKKLNLGCGYDIREGWTNLDAHALPGVDVVYDLAVLPLPFREAEFDYILCQDILEHLDYIPVLKEIYRILKPGGVLEVRVPHFTSRWSYMDPTHKQRFSIQTFNFFTRDSYDRRQYYFDFHFTRIISRRIVFEKGWNWPNRLLERVFNLNPALQSFYEATGWSRLFPAGDVLVKLQK